MSKKNIGLSSRIIYAFSAFICIAYFVWIYAYSFEFPISEDVFSGIRPVLDFYQQHSWSDKYQAITFQHAEHRLISSRLVSIISISLFDYISVRFWYMAGGLCVLAVIAVIYLDQKKSNTAQPIDLFFYVLIFLNPAYRTGVFAGWGISNFASVLFPMLAILCLHRSGWRSFTGLLVFSYLSINTQGNGFLLIPLTAVYFLTNKNQNSNKKLIMYLAFSVLVGAVYFYGFNDGGGYLRGGYQAFMQHPLDSSIFYLLAVLAWIGQWIIIPEQIMHQYRYGGVVLSAAMGLVLLLIYSLILWESRKKLIRDYSVRFYMLMYMVITIIGAAWNRSLIMLSLQGSTATEALWFVLDTRYTFYALCVFVMMISLCLSIYRTRQAAEVGRPGQVGRSLTACLCILGVLYWGARYYESLPYMDKERQTQRLCIKKWQLHKQAKNCLWHSETASILIRAEQRGLIRIGE